MKRGVLYIAAGESYVAAACASAESVRRSSPGLALGLFGDARSIESARVRELFHFVKPIAGPHRRSKVDYLEATPFDETLYLDADTRALAPLDDVFALLESFDVALGHAHARNRALTNQSWRRELPASFPQFNGGVIAYRRRSEVLGFLRAWRAAFHAAGLRKDQVTLRELLWSSPLRIATLPPEYNVRSAAVRANLFHGQASWQSSQP